MSKAKLKKYLLSLDKEDIVALVAELYDNVANNKEYLEFWLDPDPDKLLEKYQLLLKRVYSTSNGTYRKSPKASTPKELIKRFNTMIAETEYVAQLKIYAAEMLEDWLTEKRVLRKTWLTRLQQNIDDAEEYCHTHDITNLSSRINHLKERHDAISKAIDTMPSIGRSRRWFKW